MEKENNPLEVLQTKMVSDAESNLKRRINNQFDNHWQFENNWYQNRTIWELLPDDQKEGLTAEGALKLLQTMQLHNITDLVKDHVFQRRRAIAVTTHVDKFVKQVADIRAYIDKYPDGPQFEDEYDY